MPEFASMVEPFESLLALGFGEGSAQSFDDPQRG